LPSSEAESDSQGRLDRAERSEPRSGALDGRAQRSYLCPDPAIHLDISPTIIHGEPSLSTAQVPSEAHAVTTSRSDQSPELRRLHVSGCADWEEVAQAISGFHDAVVREAAIVGDEYLDRDYMLRMTSETGASARLLIHIQRHDVPAVELRFVGVREFPYNHFEQVDPARCSARRDGLLKVELASVAVTARSCEVILLDATALGEGARLADLSAGEPGRVWRRT